VGLLNADIVFVHGRPTPDPVHAQLAESVGARFLPVDFALRYHDLSKGRGRRYLSWALSALRFPDRRRVTAIITEGLAVPPVLMRRFALLRPDQRLIGLMDDEMLYFLASNRYAPRTARRIRAALGSYDALVCVGTMMSKLARAEVRSGPRILTVRSAVSSERLVAFESIRPALDASTVLFIGNAGDAPWRVWYKGIDVLLDALAIAGQVHPGIEATLVGDLEAVRARVDGDARAQVRFVGPQRDLRPFLSRASVYLHLGRGDAWAVSVLEAMAAGVPAIVSSVTGSAEVVARVDERLVVEADAAKAAAALSWYWSLPHGEKQALSARARSEARQFSEARAATVFVDAVRSVLEPSS
jgi:glycosyltransferase involved in cell wall biosynthesis